MASGLSLGSEDRFAVEARETSDVLRQGDPTVIMGAHGTSMIAYAVPEKHAVAGEFPKVSPSGRFRSNSPVQEVVRTDQKLMTDVGPVLFHNTDGGLFRIRGHSRARENRFDWSVVWEGANLWRVRGGIVVYELGDIRKEIIVPEKGGPDVVVTQSAGWIVLQLEGSQHDPTFYGSHFVPSFGKIEAPKDLFHDFSYSFTDNPAPIFSGPSSASIGQFPIAWVGVIDNEPVIFPSYLMGEFPGTTCPAPVYILPLDFNATTNPEDMPS